LTPRQRQGAAWSLQNAARAALLLLPLVLLGCSSLALPTEDAPASGPDPADNGLVVKRLKTFKDYDSYDAFEISDFRWVHSVKGWSWLACVRFQDRGHRRTYALFVKKGAIIDGRYAVETDGCETQSYSPFEPTTGARRPPSAGDLEPLH
jgi:hypothetical protein